MPSSTWRTAGRESCGAMRTPMEGRSKGMEWATKVWELKERPPSLVCFVLYLVINPVHLKHIVWVEWTWRVTHFTHVISCYAKSVLWWSSYFPGLKSWLSHHEAAARDGRLHSRCQGACYKGNKVQCCVADSEASRRFRNSLLEWLMNTPWMKINGLFGFQTVWMIEMMVFELPGMHDFGFEFRIVLVGPTSLPMHNSNQSVAGLNLQNSKCWHHAVFLVFILEVLCLHRKRVVVFLTWETRDPVRLANGNFRIRGFSRDGGAKFKILKVLKCFKQGQIQEKQAMWSQVYVTNRWLEV